MKVLLYSGGLDSSCAWWVLGRPAALYCGGSFGPARHANLGEMAAIENQLEISPEFRRALNIMEFDFRPFMREGEYRMPREMICAQLAWARGFDTIQIAYTKDDGVSESWAATQAENYGAAVGMKGFRVEFPVRHLTKRELVRQALKAGAPPGFLRASHSCLNASTACGKCKSCKQRKAALRGI